MSALRTVRCPHCGAENLLGRACPCAGAIATPPSRFGRALSVVLTFALTAGAIIVAALALAESAKPGYGIALAVGAWLLAALWRLGHDWDDGIDVRQLIFPAPFDWPVKWQRLWNFWTDDRPYFRAISLGCFVALVVVLIVVGPALR
jgi:hypothetical protein